MQDIGHLKLVNWLLEMKKPSKQVIALVSALMASLLIMACGQKGPLRHPESSTSSIITPEQG